MLLGPVRDRQLQLVGVYLVLKGAVKRPLLAVSRSRGVLRARNSKQGQALLQLHELLEPLSDFAFFRVALVEQKTEAQLEMLALR
jgi:hypothetical protein